jgi:hypothetical protein
MITIQIGQRIKPASIGRSCQFEGSAIRGSDNDAPHHPQHRSRGAGRCGHCPTRSVDIRDPSDIRRRAVTDDVDPMFRRPDGRLGIHCPNPKRWMRRLNGDTECRAIETIHAGYWTLLRDLFKTASVLIRPQRLPLARHAAIYRSDSANTRRKEAKSRKDSSLANKRRQVITGMTALVTAPGLAMSTARRTTVRNRPLPEGRHG